MKSLAPIPDNCPRCNKKGFYIKDERGAYCSPCGLWTVEPYEKRLENRIREMAKLADQLEHHMHQSGFPEHTGKNCRVCVVIEALRGVETNG